MVSDDKLIFVESVGDHPLEEREAIVKQLYEMNRNQPNRGVVVDHREAQIDMSPNEAYTFGKLIHHLQTMSLFPMICVVAAESNRFVIDLSATVASSRGVPITVCESRAEAMRKVSRCSSPGH